jgi:hypothetical protein
VGGIDLVAGGTWLAIRERRCLVAVLNRYEGRSLEPDPRRPSRGWLALEVASAGDGHPARAAQAARLWLGADRYAPCSLVVAGPEGAFLVTNDGAAPPRVDAIAPGWHALTHADLDDPGEPRAAWLAQQLREFQPRSIAEAESRLAAWLADHGGPHPAVCLHEGRMRTVSSSHVWLAPGAARYRHGEGPSCTAEILDYTSLLESSSA